jgi:hypothetical protein
MKRFYVFAAQGELSIRRLGDLPQSRKLPKGFVILQPENGRLIIGHSETGHHHVIDAAGATVGVMEKPPAGMRVLHMILENPLELKHLRDHDTHGTLTNEPGVYEVRIGREFDHYAELARQSAD